MKNSSKEGLLLRGGSLCGDFSREGNSPGRGLLSRGTSGGNLQVGGSPGGNHPRTHINLLLQNHVGLFPFQLNNTGNQIV